MKRCTHRLVATYLAVVLAPAAAWSQVTFTDVATSRGIQSYSMTPMGGGVAAADFDDDGDVDFFVPNESGVADQLYRNLGNGFFEEIATAAGLASTEGSRAALWFDYDGDAALDLIVASDCFQICDPQTVSLTLYRQIAAAQFTNVSASAMLPTSFLAEHVAGLSAGDIDRDGYLDFLVTVWGGLPHLFLNQGDGTFADISASAGIGVISDTFWQPMMHDFNGDNWPDIYAAVDFGPNRLWINQQDNTFVDVAPSAGADNSMNDMGMSLGDFDGDGDLDVYVTNIFGYQGADTHNILLRNDTVGSTVSFTEISKEAGVDQGHWGWGTTFADFDRDTRPDLAATNGFASSPWLTDPSLFYLNQGGAPVTFADVSSQVGFDDTHWGSSLVAADFDRDGDQDLLQTCVFGGPVRLLDNVPGAAASGNGYLVIKPRMAGPNHRAIGTVVRARVGGTSMMRLITAGTSFMGQEPAEAFFGTGAAAVVDEVTIEWPNGTLTTLTNLATNQLLTVTDAAAVPECLNDGDCNDGLFCNGLETCNQGCVAAPAVVCDAAPPCTVESCDNALAQCVYTPVPFPVETAGLRLDKPDPTLPDVRLSWDLHPAALLYNVYSSNQGDAGDVACLTPDLPDPTLVDTSAQPPGSVTYYMTTAVNCNGESTLGYSDGGQERLNTAPCHGP